MRKTALLIATALLTTALTACSGNGGTSATGGNTASNETSNAEYYRKDLRRAGGDN